MPRILANVGTVTHVAAVLVLHIQSCHRLHILILKFVFLAKKTLSVKIKEKDLSAIDVRGIHLHPWHSLLLVRNAFQTHMETVIVPCTNEYVIKTPRRGMQLQSTTHLTQLTTLPQTIS